jgi:atypical dual specificity phosphatase
MKERVVLELDGFGVAFGQRVVLADVALRLEGAGTTALMGPGGSGKSTLLRTIAGLNDAQPVSRIWGVARYLGVSIGDTASRPYIVAQKARLVIASVRENVASALPRRSSLTPTQQNAIIEEALALVGLGLTRPGFDAPVVSLPIVQQRLLSLACAACSEEPLVMVDEITAGLDEAGVVRVIDGLRVLARERTVLFVTHHRGHAQAASSRVALLAGGRIVECTPTERFFSHANSDAGRVFAATGGCSLPSPMAEVDMLAPGVTPSLLPPSAVDALLADSANDAPTGFFWLEKGKLAGMARPGLLVDADLELAQLEGLGVTDLVTLEERATVQAGLAARHGIRVHQFPIVDMQAPTVASTRELHGRVTRWIAEGRVVAVHCRAGLGRTGTMLVAMRILSGEDPVAALTHARNINPAWVQSEAQLAFLEEVGKDAH